MQNVDYFVAASFSYDNVSTHQQIGWHSYKLPNGIIERGIAMCSQAMS